MSDKMMRTLLVVGPSAVLIGVVAGTGYFAFLHRFEKVAVECVQVMDPPTTDTPIRVRGGSMTVLTDAVGGFQNNSAALQNCVTVSDFSYIEVGGFRDKADGTGKPKDGKLTDRNNPWTMTVLGHNSDDVISGSNPPKHSGTKTSVHGFTFSSHNTACDGTAGQSITVSLYNYDSSNQVRFYPILLPLKIKSRYSHDRTGTIRFFDGSQAFLPGATSGKLDEEFQERISEISLSDTGGANEEDYYCPDGDCSIGLGVP